MPVYCPAVILGKVYFCTTLVYEVKVLLLPVPVLLVELPPPTGQAAMAVYPVCAVIAVVSPEVSRENLTTSSLAVIGAKLFVQVTSTSWPRTASCAAEVTVKIFLVPVTAAEVTVTAVATPVAVEISFAVQVVAASAAKISLSAVSFRVPAAATTVFGLNLRTKLLGVDVAHKVLGKALVQVGEAAATTA